MEVDYLFTRTLIKRKKMQSSAQWEDSLRSLGLQVELHQFHGYEGFSRGMVLDGCHSQPRQIRFAEINRT